MHTIMRLRNITSVITTTVAASAAAAASKNSSACKLMTITVPALLLLSLATLHTQIGAVVLPLPLVNVAWAGGDDDTPPLANGLPDNDLCEDCEDHKNVISGTGLIVGTDHEDFIIGSSDDDVVFAKNSDDIILTDLGTDRIYGGPGKDTIQGGPGNDQLFGENGDDQLFGGFDDDLLVGGGGNNHLFGDIGNDVLKGGDNTGANYFDCGEGIDIIIDFDPARGDITAGNCEIF